MATNRIITFGLLLLGLAMLTLSGRSVTRSSRSSRSALPIGLSGHPGSGLTAASPS